MKGVGGPLLCSGDLLSDLREEHEDPNNSLSPSASTFSFVHSDPLTLPSSDFKLLFQKHYDRLNGSLNTSEHSWAQLTLKLCAALTTAENLVQKVDDDASLLSKNVKELEKIYKRIIDAALDARAIHASIASEIRVPLSR